MDEESSLEEFPRDITRGLGHLCGAIAVLFIAAIVTFVLNVDIGTRVSVTSIVAILVISLILLSVVYYFMKAAMALLSIGEPQTIEVPTLSYKIILYIFLGLGLLLFGFGCFILFTSSFQALIEGFTTLLGVPLMLFLANLTRTVIDDRSKR